MYQQKAGGLKLYDPRDGEYKVSSNPALILYYFIGKYFREEDVENIKDAICDMADFCESKGHEFNLVSRPSIPSMDKEQLEQLKDFDDRLMAGDKEGGK